MVDSTHKSSPFFDSKSGRACRRSSLWSSAQHLRQTLFYLYEIWSIFLAEKGFGSGIYCFHKLHIQVTNQPKEKNERNKKGEIAASKI